MSSELDAILHKASEEERKRKEKELAEGMNRYKSLLLKIAKEKKLDVLISSEGTKAPELNKNEQDLNMLEKAQLVEGQTKFTHRNEYRQYVLTPKGSELAEKLAKET